LAAFLTRPPGFSLDCPDFYPTARISIANPDFSQATSIFHHNGPLYAQLANKPDGSLPSLDATRSPGFSPDRISIANCNPDFTTQPALHSAGLMITLQAVLSLTCPDSTHSVWGFTRLPGFSLDHPDFHSSARISLNLPRISH
jgi:hypothetical protein